MRHGNTRLCRAAPTQGTSHTKYVGMQLDLLRAGIREAFQTASLDIGLLLAVCKDPFYVERAWSLLLC